VVECMNMARYSFLAPEDRRRILKPRFAEFYPPTEMDKDDIELEREIEAAEDAFVTAPIDIEIPRFDQSKIVIQSHDVQLCPDNEKFNMLEDLPKPDFFVLGLSAAAGLRVIQNFEQHPQIKAPVKDYTDPGFFAFPGVSKLDVIEYQHLYLNKNPGPQNPLLVGDFSSTYLIHPLAPRRLATTYPDAKIVIYLRNPVQRAYSHYQLMRSKSLEELPFEDIVQYEMHDLLAMRNASRSCFMSDTCDVSECYPTTALHRHNVDHSRWKIKHEREWREYLVTSYLFPSVYDDQVERWMEAFPGNVLVMFYDEFLTDKEASYQQIHDFLGLTQVSLPGNQNNNVKPLNEKRIGSGPLALATKEKLDEFFRPFNERLFKLVGKSAPW